MRETPINHKVNYTHNQFDTQKSFDARTAKLNDNTSYQTSFDNYFSKNTTPKDIQKKINHAKNDSGIKTETKKQPSNTERNNKSPEKKDGTVMSETEKNNPETNSSDSRESQNKDKETSNSIYGFLIDLTQTIMPLPQNISDTALTGLDLDSGIELNLDTFALGLDDTTDDDMTAALLESLDTHQNSDIMNALLDNKTDTNIDISQNVNNNNDTQSSLQSITGLNLHNHNQMMPHIQIQRASQAEVIAQIPLQNNFSLAITKDSDNPNKIGINLEPAGMGNVELVIENNKDNSVTAIIRSDKPEILDQLRKETASLERYLNEAGLNLGGNGLGFEHKSQNNNDDNKKPSSDDMLTASIGESAIHNQHGLTHTNETLLYAALDRQSIQAGLDIRL